MTKERAEKKLKAGESQAECNRRVFQLGLDADDAGWIPGQEPARKLERTPATKKPSRKKLLLAEVARRFDIASACVECGVSFADMKGWLEDPAYKLEVELAQRAFVGEHEKFLVDVSFGRVDKKISQAAATLGIAFQNSRNPEWGRTRVENVKQAVAPLLKIMAEVLQEEYGTSHNRAKELCARISDLFELRLAPKFSK